MDIVKDNHLAPARGNFLLFKEQNSITTADCSTVIMYVSIIIIILAKDFIFVNTLYNHTLFRTPGAN